MTDYETFLRNVFGFKDPSHYIQIWLLKDRGTRRFAELDAAVDFVDGHSERNCYVCVGLVDEDLGLYKRGEERDIVALSGLVVEADFARPGSDKKGPLPTQEQALSLIEEMPHPASCVNMSGHGYHAWWAFKEPWLIESTEERERLKTLSMRWSGMFKALAKERGFAVDSVYDLTRVMRLPGTMNNKDPDEPVEAKIVVQTDWRAGDLETFESVIREDLLVPRYAFEQNAGELVGDGLVLSPHAEAPIQKRKVLADNIEDLWHETMHYDRDDLDDQSPSGYDMSAATIVAQAGWEPQEIANLLIEMRRRNGAEMKLDRPDYYRRTIAKALRYAERENAEKEVVAADKDGQNPTDTIARILQQPIDRIVKTPSPGGAVYGLEYDGVVHELGEIKNLVSQTFFIRRWADISGILLEKRKGKWWHQFAQLLLDQCVIEDIGEEATLGGSMRARVEEYLYHHSVQPEGQIVEAIRSNQPFRLDDTIGLTTSGIQPWLQVEGLKMTRRQIALGFRRAGFERKTYSYAYEGGGTSRSVWLLPDDMALRILERLEREGNDAILGVEEWT